MYILESSENKKRKIETYIFRAKSESKYSKYISIDDKYLIPMV
jgi:hypothetical protein